MSDLPSEKHPVTPEMLDAAKNAREGWLRFQDDLLDRIATAEAAAEEARQTAFQLEHEKIALRADLAEARQERDAAKDAGWDWMVKANERFARIGELEAALRLWYGDDPEAALAATDAALQPTPDPAAEVQT